MILKDPEYREIQRVARSRHMSLAEWVRQVLDLARRQEPLGSIGKKLEIIQRAAQHDYPVGDIDGILAEIEAGYGTGARSPAKPTRTSAIPIKPSSRSWTLTAGKSAN